jgi:pimeloyl-ACP methyl ester carboxylesterase
METRKQLSDAGIPWEIVADSGHWPFADQPERFVELLTAFLQKIPSSGSGQ